MSNDKPFKFKEILWHDDAVSYAAQFGLTREDCELILLNKSRPSLDPRSAEVGHLIVRYRAGDVTVVVGHRDKDLPAVMSVWVDDHNYKGGTRKQGGAGSTAPNNMKALTKRILEAGYKIEHAGGHLKVRDKDTGVMLMTMPSTPSDYRSIPNAWTLFLRKRAANETAKREKERRDPA